MKCPVCPNHSIKPLITIDEKRYWKCHRCEARFLDAQHYVDARREYAHYLHHENNVDDCGYRNFLQKTVKPLLKKLKPISFGLDYGCGPGPALAAMLREAGHHVSLYDPYFHPGKQILSAKYDFITCTETTEHFHHPAEEFSRFHEMLKPGGWLAIMTCHQTDDDKFANWHYRRDPTHVVFYRKATFVWLANHYDWSCEFPAKDVALMQKCISKA